MSIGQENFYPKGTIFQATQENYEQLADFFNQYHYIHRHLDWFAPLDWLGEQPFLYKITNKKIQAVICAVPENKDIAWIRAFGLRNNDHIKTMWHRLLTETISQLKEKGIKKIVSLALHGWFEDLLIDANFENHHNIVVLEWQGTFPQKRPVDLFIRSMTDSDLKEVQKIDHYAFPPVWQNSLIGLKKARNQTGISTVAIINERIIGYQISTAMTIYGHLARLAVHPEYQRLGIGYTIVHDLLKRFDNRGFWRITVNTQSNNIPSLKLYKEFDFKRTGEEIPVYELAI